MKWNVVNANSRDVERQHLNKILKEIESTSSKLERDIGNVSGSVDNVQRTINTTVTKIVNETLPLSSLITSVTLTGDVAGTSVLVPGSNAVTITTYLSEDYVQEAPIDNNYYWRFQGNWQPVPQAVINLQTLPDNGFIIQDTEGFWQSRVLESASSGNITITNPDGNEGNPVFDLSEIEPLEQGAILGLEFDEYGRRVGQRDVTTDDLTEGDDNLYYTDERAQDSVGSIIVGDETIDVIYDDDAPSITIGLTEEYKDRIDLAVVSSNTPTDGDILEFDGVTGSWVAKKDPRELLIDGGNF